MKTSLINHQFLAAICVAFASVSCDSYDGKNGSQHSSESSSQSAIQSQKINEALKTSGVLLPSGKYDSVTEKQAIVSEQAARRILGDRGIFNDIHEKQGVTLLPAKSALALNETQDEEQIAPVVINGEQCQADQAKKVCASACATATANAYAFAFAHASATACAWAQAWACVFTFSPFSQVCSWASSQACVTSFSSAFGAAFSSDTKTVCNTQCSQ